MITVVLVEPEHPGNIGAVARCMANFDLKELILINPKVNHLSEEARCRAKNEQKILEKAKVKDFSILKKFDHVVGTTAKMGTDYNIPRSPLHPDEFAERVKQFTKKSRIALVFGRESVGLLNKEIALCDFVVTIPTSKKYPSLNLSHAASVIFYELHKAFGEDKITAHLTAATKRDKEQILKMADEILADMRFTTADKRETQRTLWKRIIGKSFLTKREAFALMGFFRKVKEK